jgi:CRISPR-associated exonuclease Cas4
MEKGSVEAHAMVLEFADIAEREDLHGLAFQHLALCERRAWLHLHRIDYAHLDEGMARGTALHDVHRPRDHSVDGLMGLSPDRIDWNNRVVFEAKGGAGAAGAVSRQTAFYALILWAREGRPWSAVTNILAAKRKRRVEIDSSLIQAMLADANHLAKLRRCENPPQASRKKICLACSYRFLCGYS